MNTPSPVYPYPVPPPRFSPPLDMLLVELPPRYMPMMPNGLAYVHNILKSTGIRFQTYDFNIAFYHRFHERRLGTSPESRPPPNPSLPDDPWDGVATSVWQEPAFLDLFSDDLNRLVAAVVAAAPAILGLSLNGLNLKVAERVVAGVRAALPRVIIVVGGYTCVWPTIGPRQFPHFDYMIIGEAEQVLPGLVRALVSGQSPRDLPGVISKQDTPNRPWVPGPLPTDLDAFGFPQYEWNDLHIYHGFKGYSLVPIQSSRGCLWSRCRFCAECFEYRHRAPQAVVDEIAWFVQGGFRHFHFNESDLNGDFVTIRTICERLVECRLDVSLIGQLRIDRRSDAAFFRLLRSAGFKQLRFGVDGWSDHTLRLQNKGYNMDWVSRNIQDAAAAGIQLAVNIVIGVPGETEEDIDVSIANFTRLKPYIHSVDNIHTLILAHRSEYHNHPERYRIVFHRDKDSLYREYAEAIPPSLWHSEEPYIDEHVRVARMQRVFDGLKKAGYGVSRYAESTIQRLRREAETP